MAFQGQPAPLTSIGDVADEDTITRAAPTNATTRKVLDPDHPTQTMLRPEREKAHLTDTAIMADVVVVEVVEAGMDRGVSTTVPRPWTPSVARVDLI